MSNTTDTTVHEIAAGIYRISTPVAPAAIPGGFTFNQFLIADDEPLLFHTEFRITAESTGALMAAVDAVPFDPAEGAVFVACQRHYATLPPDTVMSVAGHRPGASPVLATYTILHRFE